MTNKQVVDKWLQGNVSGQNGKGTIFFEGDTIYSYGKHYPLAQIVGNKVFVNMRPSSVTTTRHRNLVFRAVWPRTAVETQGWED